jgi:transposase
MGKANFTEDFKRDAVLQITERGYPVAEVAARLGISKYSLYEWKKRYAKPAAARDDEQAAEVRRLTRVLLGATVARHIIKKAAAYFAKDAK